MAALSEIDRQKILGDNYKEIETRAQKNSGIIDADRLRAERAAKLDDHKFNAVAVFIVGAILLISNWMAVSGPSLLLVTGIALALIALGVVWYVMLVKNLRAIAAQMTTK